MIVFVLCAIAGISNAIMDTVALKGGGILPKGNWWSMDKSWRNKWKNGDPNQGEAFLGSSTVFVFVTDAWHFFQMIMLTCFIASIAMLVYIDVPIIYNRLFTSVLIFIGGKLSFSIPFELLWRFLNRKSA